MGGRARILVIDDEPSIVAYLTTLLEDEGYETRSASDAERGMALAHECGPDLICLDIMMPKWTGIALYRQMRRDPALERVPVLFVSGYTQAHNTLRPGTLGFFESLIPDPDVPPPQGFIEKPIDVAEFVRTVSTIIESPA